MTTNLLYASDLAVEAFNLNLKDSDTRTAKLEHCAFCGRELPKGTSAVPYETGPNFNDTNFLKCRHSRYACLSCNALTSRKILLYGGKIAIHSGKAFSMTRYKTLAYYLENPPKPPFILAYATAKQQHVLWKAPVNLSNKIFHVQFGNLSIPVHRPRLKETQKTIEKLRLAMEESGLKVNAYSPFVKLDIELKDAQHGMIRQDLIHAAAENKTIADLLQPLYKLKPFDVWAIAVLRLEIIEPEPFEIEKLSG